jgi:ABC-type transport system involved in multi-copper enzyme maturation permease subunit
LLGFGFLPYDGCTMLGPVLYQEMLLGARRNRAYFFRWFYAGWIVLQLCGLLFVHVIQGLVTQGKFDLGALADFSRSYLPTLVTQHYLVLLLATPVLTAGAITDEKSRGTLQYLLVTALLPWEILVGKLIGRLYQVFLIALTPLPLLCFLGVFGGLDLLILLSLGISSLALALGIGSMSLLASVLCRHTRDAVLWLYTTLAVFYLGGAAVLNLLTSLAPATPSIWLTWLEMLLNCLDPVRPMGSGWSLDDARERSLRVLASVFAWGLLGAVCLALATMRLRGSYLRYLEHASRRRWWPALLARRAPLRGDPLRWKERHVEGIAPLAALRAMPRWLGLTLVFLLTSATALYILAQHLESPYTVSTVINMGLSGDMLGLARVQRRMSPSSGEFSFQGLVVMLVAGLVIAIRCSGAVTGEREKGTWEALLLTPLETRQLIRSKLWGIIGASMPYLAAYAVPALALAALGGGGPLLWTAVWLGVTLLAMVFVGAAGLWCSVRSRSSWRSLLGTLGITYVGGFVLSCLTSPIIAIMALVIYLLLELVERRLGIAATRIFGDHYGEVVSLVMCLTLAGAFAFLAWRFVIAAEYRVSVLERTKHWRNEPRHPQWSRFARERLQE